MLTLVPPSDCTEAREAASARLDGELSEFEAARLAMHLSECAECRAYAEGIRAITAGLRVAPLEQPQIQVLLPRRSSRLPLLATAACVGLLAAVGASWVALDGVGNPAQPLPAATTFLQAGPKGDFDAQHLLAMLRRYELQPPKHQGGVRAI